MLLLHLADFDEKNLLRQNTRKKSQVLYLKKKSKKDFLFSGRQKNNRNRSQIIDARISL
jgi:hypothetical protein